MVTTKKKASVKTPVQTESVEVSMPAQQTSKRIDLLRLIPKTYTPLLMVLLLIASFFLGMLLDKVQYLQAGSGAYPTQQQAGNQAQQQPGQAIKVGDVSLGHFPIMGNKDAKVTMIEFADFRCPYCENFFTQTESQLIADYVKTGKVKFVFRQFPFLGPASNVAADAAECANDQGKFWEMHDYLYKNQPPESDTSMYNTDTLTQAAASLGLNGDQFRSCLDNKSDDSKAQADYQEGQKIGVSGTPSFIINGQLLVGALPYAQFKTIIDQELAKK